MYQKENKVDICRQLFEEIRLVEKNDVFKQKIRDKIVNIIVLLKKQKDKIDIIE